MAYTNSPLVSYTKLSPNHSGQRTHSIDRITPHCVVGQCSVETLGNIFLPTSRQASSTYYNGKAIPGWVKKLRWYVVEVSGDRAVINNDESGRYAIMSPIKVSALSVVGAKPAENYRIHTVVHGDTLWTIAKKYLGNGSRYKEIVSLNGLKSNVIYSGMKLKIPNK